MGRPIGIDEYLGLMAENDCHVVVERSVPRGKLKRDTATIKSADGRDVGWDGRGLVSGRIELPIATLNHYLQAGLMSGAEPDAEGREVFRLTDDGRKHAVEAAHA